VREEDVLFLLDFVLFFRAFCFLFWFAVSEFDAKRFECIFDIFSARALPDFDCFSCWLEVGGIDGSTSCLAVDENAFVVVVYDNASLACVSSCDFDTDCSYVHLITSELLPLLGNMCFADHFFAHAARAQIPSVGSFWSSFCF